MSTLNVSALKNIGAGFTNLLLNSDGSVTLPVYTNASTPPVQFQAGTLWFNGTTLQIRNAANTTWVSVGGGGGGTVTGVAGTAPIVSSGGSAPTISILPATTGAAGSLSAADKVKIDALPATIVAAVSGTAPIVIGGTASNPDVTITAATTAATGSVQLADAAASQGGTSATLVSTPAFTVSKDAATMTGAAILPSGTDLQRAAIATPVVGMQRFNTDSGFEEVYTGVTGGWKDIQFVPTISPLPANYTVATGAQTLPQFVECNNFTVTAGAVVTPPSRTSGSIVVAYGDVTINASTWNYTGIGAQGPSTFPAIASIPTVGSGYAPGISIQGGFGYSPFASLGGSSGGGTGTATGGNAATGGNGGGYLVIRCYGSLTINGTVVMNAAGTNSVINGNGGSGGSGGGGGVINLRSSGPMTIPATATFNVVGGNAAFGPTAFGGCGGGGGGWVILESPLLTDSSTKNLTGGNGAAAGSAPAQPGMGGGGSAGSGGNSPYPVNGAGADGSIGIFATSGSII